MSENNSSLPDDVPLVSIVIMNYNGIDYLENCLNSVFKSINCTFEVLLIDNNSSDNSHITCKSKFPKIRLFQNKKNLAMAARNVGIDNAQGKFIVFLDSDTTVEPDWLEHLISSYNSHGDGLYQGKILEKEQPEILGSCGNFLNLFGFGFARGTGEKNIGQYEKYEQISFPVGACMFSSLDTIKKIGYFDESNLLFLMLDDVDYGWKALCMGIFSYYEPKSIVYHIGSTSGKLNPRKMYLLEKNRWVCLLSFYSTKTILKLLPLLFFFEIGLFCFYIIKGVGIEKIRATFSVIKMMQKIIVRKKEIQHMKKLNDKEIISHFVDDIALPSTIINKKLSNLANFFIINLSKIARKII
jgi:GT2 family glycosyltransferase